MANRINVGRGSNQFTNLLPKVYRQAQYVPVIDHETITAGSKKHFSVDISKIFRMFGFYSWWGSSSGWCGMKMNYSINNLLEHTEPITDYISIKMIQQAIKYDIFKKFDDNVRIDGYVQNDNGFDVNFYNQTIVGFIEDEKEEIIKKELYEEILKYGVMKTEVASLNDVGTNQESSAVFEMGYPMLIMGVTRFSDNNWQRNKINIENRTNRQKLSYDGLITSGIEYPEVDTALQINRNHMFFADKGHTVKLTVANMAASITSEKVVIHGLALV